MLGRGETVGGPASRTDLAIAAALFCASLLWFSLSWDRHFELRDDGLLLRFGARVAAGEVPHRDFQDAYGPGAHLLTGLGVKLWDGEILPVRRMLACLKAAAVVLGYAIARFVAPRPFALFASLLALGYWGRTAFNLNTPYAALETVPLCLTSLWLLLRAGSRRGFAAAGFAAGAAILWKQSLGLFHVYGMALALCAVCAVEASAPRRGPRASAAAIALWGVAALAPPVALREYLNLRDYLLYFLPLHLLMGWVALRVSAGLDPAALRARLAQRLLPFLCGAALLPAATALAYLHWQRLGDLIANTLVLPRQVENYVLPATLPPPGLALALGGAIGLCSAALRALAGRSRHALVLAAFSAALLAAAPFAPAGALAALDVAGLERAPLFSPAILWQAGAFFVGVQSTLIALAALACARPAFQGAGAAADAGPLRFVLPVLFFHLMISLQSFPRASYNTWIVQGAFMPLLAFVLTRWWAALGPAAGARRVAAAALVALLPLWAVAPVVQRTLVLQPYELPRVPLGVPKTAGIAVGGPFVSEWLDGFRALVPWLSLARPAHAPLLVLGNEEMIYYTSGREPLFPELELQLFLLGWGLLPEPYVDALDGRALCDRLRATPDAIVVDHRGDDASLRLRAALPELAACVDSELEGVADFGSYRVLRRAPR